MPAASGLLPPPQAGRGNDVALPARTLRAPRASSVRTIGPDNRADFCLSFAGHGRHANAQPTKGCTERAASARETHGGLHHAQGQDDATPFPGDNSRRRRRSRCRMCAAPTPPASCRSASGITGCPAPTTRTTALVNEWAEKEKVEVSDRLHHLAGQQEPAHHRRRGAGEIRARHSSPSRPGSRRRTPRASSRSTTSWPS